MFNKGQLAGLMKKAQTMQEDMKKAQDELGNIEVTGESGAGLVKVTMTCKHDVKRITIDPSLLADDKDMLEDLVAAAELPPAQRAAALDQLKKGERPKKQQQPKPEPKPAKAQPRHMHPLADALFQVDDAEQALQGALQYLKEQGGPEVGLVAKQVEKLLGEVSKVMTELESLEVPPPPEWKTWRGAKWKPSKEEAMRRILLFLEHEGPHPKMHLAQAVGFWDASSDPNAKIFNNAVAQLQRDRKIINKGGAWQLTHKPKRK